ncbi:MAG: bifunctional phosphoribosylaminoimidazolecarboxamide formyltransferase/IMP cyclohydrolase, partial [Gaiellaceae bacterium]
MNASPNDQGSERDLIPIRRALVSVSDKTGLLELAAALAAAGVEIVSTGTTAAKIREAGHTVTDVSSVTGFPESLNGRVKTLHPAVHAGILADLRLPSHAAQLVDLGIAPFELVVVNLYPFAETVASGAAPDDVIEQIDIGGPAMVRSAAKNFANVAVVVSAAGGYATLIDAITEHTGTTLAERRSLAAAAFTHTAAYDTAVSDWFAGSSHPAAVVRLQGDLKQVLRYGENSHQNAALYLDSPEAGGGVQNGRGIAQSEQLHGKEMSYNNYVDADAALRAAYDFDGPTVAVVKHANPCGIAIGADIAEAHRKAHATDPVSAFGGVIAANAEVSVAMAEQVAEIFTEVVLAPAYAEGALEVLARKKNVRVLRLATSARQGGV